MKRKTWIYGGLGAAALAALLAWAFAPRPLEVEVAQVDRGVFETTIDEDGRTRLRDLYVVAAPVGGRLERIALRAGDRVDVGAAVAEITALPAPMIDARTRGQLVAAVAAAQAEVRRAAAGASAARIALTQATDARRRSEQLSAQGYVAAAKAETDALAEQSAARALDAAVQAERVAQQGLAQAQAALAVTQPGTEGLRRLPVTSPVAGRVLRVLQASETAVAAGTPLIEIGDVGRLEVLAELLTTDALQARPGSVVRIEHWGGPGTLAGRVRAVEPSAFTKISALGVEEQRVNVLIDLTSPPEQWRALGDGFRVSVRIVTQRVDDALRVPVSAVFPLPPGPDGADAGHAVFAVEGGRARQVPVQVGARNGSHAWLTNGLQVGATVIVYPPPAVRDGTRVRVREG
jgi:HlyD family secretion protein